VVEKVRQRSTVAGAVLGADIAVAAAWPLHLLAPNTLAEASFHRPAAAAALVALAAVAVAAVAGNATAFFNLEPYLET